MTKLEELKAAYEAALGAETVDYVDYVALDVIYATLVAYYAELKKTQKENTND